MQTVRCDPGAPKRLVWAAKHGIEVPERLQTYFERMKRVPSVARALAEEGLA